MARRTGSNRGFTLLESLIVASILVTVTAVAVPNVVVTLSNSRLRANLTSLSGVLQSTRMLAVKQNRTMTTRMTAQLQGMTAYAKLASDGSNVVVHDMQVEMEAPIVKVSTPSGAGAPSTLDTSVLGFTPQIGDPSFNSRGLPCTYSGGNCVNNGFAYYFHDSRPGRAPGWAAVSISPAGRIKKWFWNGSGWTD